jgi:hypothetical protein
MTVLVEVQRSNVFKRSGLVARGVPLKALTNIQPQARRLGSFAMAPKAATDTNPTDKKRPGNPGNFRGKRLEFLLGQEEELLKSSGGKTDTAFYNSLFSAYWKLFSWRLKLIEDLPDGVLPPDMEEVLSEDDEKKRVEAVSSTHLVSILLHHINTSY